MKSFDLGCEFVDDLGVAVDAPREFGFVLTEPLVVGFEVDHSCLQVLKSLRDSVDLFALALEFCAEVGVFVGEHPAFDAGLRGRVGGR